MYKKNNLELKKEKLYINSKLINTPIILVGMMGVGKTAIGKLLAASLNREFYDIDTNIEKNYNLKINDIFELYGEKKFRKIEQNEIKNIKKNSKLIVATGGGAFTFKNNYEIINKIGLSIWIKANAKIIKKRVKKNIKKRPMLKVNNLDDHINNLLKTRNPIYANAKIHIESMNISKQQMCNKIIKSDLIEKIKSNLITVDH